MSRVITFSRQFPSYHFRAEQLTGFVKSILKQQGIKEEDEDYIRLLYALNDKGLTSGKILHPHLISFAKELRNEFKPIYTKKHTIRSGNHWKAGDKFSPRVWSGKPYRSPQIIFAPDIEVKKVWDFKIRTSRNESYFLLNDLKIKPYNYQEEMILLEDIAANDGLGFVDFLDWFKYPNEFSGQIICFDENVNY